MSIPKELKNNARWCGWRYEERGGQKTKVPYNPRTLQRAQSNAPETFGSWGEVEDALTGGYVDGVGIRIGDGYSAIDIDHCVIDGVISDIAMDICCTMMSYAEKSPSGSGIRIIFKTNGFEYDRERYYIKNPNNGIEVYTDGTTNRFVTMTGDTLYGYPINDNTDALAHVLEKYMVRPSKTAPKKLTDDDIITKASASRQGDKFNALWSGNISPWYTSRSEADQALCSILAFWCAGDAAQIDRLFRMSGLMRDKWHRDDYRKATINNAITLCTQTYDPSYATEPTPPTDDDLWSALGVPPLQTGDWRIDEDGVTREVLKKRSTGETETIRASHTPVVPSAYFVNPETGDHKVEISFIRNKQLCTHICDKETVLSKTKILKLTNKGLNFTSANANELTRYFADMETLNGDTIPHYISASHVGWVGDNFVPYTGDIRFDGEDENGATYQALNPKGDVNAWIDYMKPLRKYPFFRIMLAASFASPLISRCGCLPFWVHLWGTTGTGKTVALIAAMSVWGDPRLGKLTKSLNATVNSMVSTLAFLNSIPFAGDELQSIKRANETFDELIMQMTEGIERGRMKYDQNLPSRTWSCSILTTGEEPVTEENNGGGTKNRVIELEVTEETFGHKGNEIIGFVSENHGFAGQKFIEHILSPDVCLENAYKQIYSKVVSTVNTTGKQAMAATLILLADKLACESIFTEDEPLNIEDIAEYIKVPEEVDVSNRAYEWLCGWVAKNPNKFNASLYSESWGKLSRNEGEVYIIASQLRKAMKEEGFSFDAVKRSWAEKGWLRQYGRIFTPRMSVNGTMVSCAVIQLPVESRELVE